MNTAAFALGKIDPAAKDVLPALIKLLHDEDQDVRRSVSYGLGQMGLPAALVLIKALQHADQDVRRWAVYALGQIGPAAVPALIEALQNKDLNVGSLVWLRPWMGLFGPFH